jgi:O-antigen biosynthesis protein
MPVSEFAMAANEVESSRGHLDDAISLIEEVNQQRKSTEQILHIHQRSLSWRLTSPLRAGMQLLRSTNSRAAAKLRDANRLSRERIDSVMPKRIAQIQNSIALRGGLVPTIKLAKSYVDKNGVGTAFDRVSVAVGAKPASTIKVATVVPPFPCVPLVNEINAVLARRVAEADDWALAVPFTGNLEGSAAKINKVAVVAHIFYDELAPDILKLIGNIACRADVFISTTSEEKRKAIEEVFRQYSNGTVEIRIFENRGRDIAPKLVGFADVYDRYEYFLHLHSKRTLHAGDKYAHWRDYLYNHLLGSKEIVASNLALLAQPEVGLVYAQHLPAVRPSLNWGWDFERASGLLKTAGVTLSQDMLLEFPSGSMFWGKSAAIRPLLNLNLKFADFEEEAGQYDGTLGHAIERSFLYFVESTSLKWAKVSVDSIDTIAPRFAASYDALPAAIAKVHVPLLESRPDVVSAISASYVGLTEYKLVMSSVLKPRLNLLIPTVNPAQTFGGVATALKVFKQLAEQFGGAFDLRILVLDAAIEPQVPLSLFAAYHLEGVNPVDRENVNVLQPGHDRMPLRLPIRRNDVFLSTAWWTAVHGFRFLDFQKARYGKAPKMMYLIQDYEPSFYGWSTKWALAESTYRRPADTVALINSEELHRSMVDQDYEFSSSFVLPFRLNESIAKNLKLVPKEKILLIYGRPGVERNCTEIVIDALRIWQLRMPTEAAKWKIISLGETYEPNIALNMPYFEIRGKVSLEEYADLLSRASIGISLMVSPHPSYPPLEMASAGVYTVTNSYRGKDLTQRSNYILSVDRVDPEFVFGALEQALMKLANNEVPSREMRDLGSVSPASLYDPESICSLFDFSSESQK